MRQPVEALVNDDVDGRVGQFGAPLLIRWAHPPFPS
jgi:hypothetical protein